MYCWVAVPSLKLLLGSVAIFFLGKPSWLALVQHATMHSAQYVVHEHVQDPSKLLHSGAKASHLHLNGEYMHHMHVTHMMHSMGSVFAKHAEDHIVTTFTVLSMQH